MEAAFALNAASIKEVSVKSRLETVIAEGALNELIQNGQLILLEDGEIKSTSDLLVIARPHWSDLRGRFENMLLAYQKQFPLRRGMPREELKSKIKLSARVFNASCRKLTMEKIIVDAGETVSIAGHEIKFDSGEQAKVRELMRRFENSPYATPSVKESQSEVGEEVFNALIGSGELVAVSPDIVFRKKDYDMLNEKVRTALIQNGQITLAEVRDMLNTTRKYAQALLEHLDSLGVTIRDGDVRKLKK